MKLNPSVKYFNENIPLAHSKKITPAATSKQKYNSPRCNDKNGKNKKITYDNIYFRKDKREKSAL